MMNRRSFLAAIPAAVAALTGAKVAEAKPAQRVTWNEYTIVSDYTDADNAWEMIDAVQLPAMIPGKLCCPRCDSDVFLHGRKLNDDHLIADRDGYHDTGRVFLDGDDVGDLCPEAMVGDNGWVLLEANRYEALCRNCCGPMQKLLRGHVAYWPEALDA